jgi:hypothetical protein
MYPENVRIKTTAVLAYTKVQWAIVTQDVATTIDIQKKPEAVFMIQK